MLNLNPLDPLDLVNPLDLLKVLLYLLVPFALGIRWVYWTYLIEILDALAGGATWILFRLPKFQRRENAIMDANLKRVLPDLSAADKAHVKFASVKLTVLNALIALHQRYLIDSDLTVKNNVNLICPSAVRDQKIIKVLAHYGVYYDFSLVNIWKLSMAPVYKIKNKLVEAIVFHARTYKDRILGINQARFKAYLSGKGHPEEINGYHIIDIVCDQNSRHGPRVTFLNREETFHSSPADVHKMTGRPIWAYLARYDFPTRKMHLKWVPIQLTLDDTPVKDIIQKIADVFTQEIMAHPEQYLWAYPRGDKSPLTPL